jgi:pantothenate kinase
MFNKLNKEVHADKYLIENKIEYPYILVNIKSGISIYKITGENV